MASNLKSRKKAIASFIFGLGFWVPLLNFIFGAFAIYFGILSLKNIKNNPEKYNGKAFAVIGIILGALVYITYLTGLGMCLYGNKDICSNIGLSFLVK